MEVLEKERIRKKIVAAITATAEGIASLAELTKPIAPDNAIGRLSRMEAINSKSINEAALTTARQKLARLKYALTKIDEPGFGFCMECGESIPVSRIMIMPESPLCVYCAE